MNDRPPEGENAVDEEREFIHFLAVALRGLPDDHPLPDEATVLAYLDRSATAEQNRVMLEALGRSSALRRHVLGLAGDLEALESPHFTAQFSGAEVVSPPSMRRFLIKQRMKHRFPWLYRRTRPGMFLIVQAASAALVILLVLPAYRGIVELPAARVQIGAIQQQFDGVSRQSNEMRQQLDSSLGEIEALKSQIQASPPEPEWRGSSVLVLALPSAGDGERAPGGGSTVLPTLVRTPGRSMQVLLFVPSIPEDAAPEALFRIEVVRKGHPEPIFRDETTAGELRRVVSDDSTGTGGWNLLLPAAELAPGEYAVRVRQLSGRPTAPVQEFPFRVIESAR
jgi:hypothetical protein